MAFPVTGGDERPPICPSGSVIHSSVKRRPDDDDNGRYKRPKVTQCGPYDLFDDHHIIAYRVDDMPHGIQRRLLPHQHSHPHTHLNPHLHPHSHLHPHTHSHLHTNQPHHSHLRHHTHSSPHQPSLPEAVTPPLERTASGLSIGPDPTERLAWTELLEDDQALHRVREHMAQFRRRNPDSKHERILRSIINPRSNSEDPLDNDSLESIFSAANEMFFNGRLSQRVRWDWSHESSAQYDSKVIGTTALRRAHIRYRGFETLIVLSSPILRDRAYSRRLLISTFMHELVHCYLFICCGFRARDCGGHTPAFRGIAKLIDDWVGPDSALHLSKMEADLERFRIYRSGDVRLPLDEGDEGNDAYSPYPCSGLTEDRQVTQQQHSTVTKMNFSPSQGHHDRFGDEYTIWIRPLHHRHHHQSHHRHHHHHHHTDDGGSDPGSSTYVYSNAIPHRPC
ncbi:hypothetical protein B0H63DRAFT_22727 [Podospora didyma]|uniref:SprT-like domain-containing protein n=1 Tax=Podospora didyma TaxID=330526 RepID=A0AAE0P5F8_9PEZI|nr:hypothetical protein B0H63DRAFT_22727 [Podospora didyma]